MTRKQMLQKMKTVLQRRRDALRRSFDGELRQFNTSEERPVGDHADLAVDSDYGAINSQLAETESRELEQIEHALERMRQGRYGICEICNQKIPMARLQALPYATTCVKCQRKAEFGNSSRQAPQDWSRVADDSGEDFIDSATNSFNLMV